MDGISQARWWLCWILHGWEEYKNGFGDVGGEFWLGNEKIHQLTEISSQLRVDIKTRNNGIKYAKYSNFTVTNQATNYTLFVGFYSGTAKDRLAYHNGMSFSTTDRDNDKTSSNCAQNRASAWWYNQCVNSDLNAPYGHNGYYWYWSNLLESEMKLKPKTKWFKDHLRNVTHKFLDLQNKPGKMNKIKMTVIFHLVAWNDRSHPTFCTRYRP